MTATQLDSLYMDAPTAKGKWDGWTARVSKALRTHEDTPETPQAWTENSVEVWTDGARKNGKATYGVYWGNTETEEGGSVTGLQEINNAELQAIQYALRKSSHIAHVTIYTDSLNSVNFLRSHLKDSDRKIRKTNAAPTKLNIIKLLADRQNRGGTWEVHHVRAHAMDNTKRDRRKRKEANRTY